MIDKSSPSKIHEVILVNICQKALGHLMKFTQRSILYRFGLGLGTAFYRLGLSTAFTDYG